MQSDLKKNTLSIYHEKVVVIRNANLLFKTQNVNNLLLSLGESVYQEVRGFEQMRRVNLISVNL